MLTADLLVYAYLSGTFPMAHPDEGNDIFWHTPKSRGLIPLDDRFKAPKNQMRLYRKKPFELTINNAFEDVITACAELRNEDTWISDEIKSAYIDLHRKGIAHSFEAWEGDRLVGGLYGLALGKAFFGESMFHRATDACKICLVFLVEFLREKNFQLLDSQYLNPHLVQFGAYEIPHEEYMILLTRATSV